MIKTEIKTEVDLTDEEWAKINPERGKPELVAGEKHFIIRYRLPDGKVEEIKTLSRMVAHKIRVPLGPNLIAEIPEAMKYSFHGEPCATRSWQTFRRT